MTEPSTSPLDTGPAEPAGPASPAEPASPAGPAEPAGAAGRGTSGAAGRAPVRLYGPQIDHDPAALYHRLRREHGPVVAVLLEGEVPAWFVVGYREVNHITGNPALFARDCRRWNAWDQVPADWPLMPYVGWMPSVMFAEGAEHQRRAGAIGDALDAVDRTELATLCEEIADRLIDGFAGDGEADLIDQYSHRIPLLVVARLFGLPDADVPALVQDVAESLDADEKAAPAHQRIHERMRDLVAERHRRPGPDVPSRLLAHPAGLTHDEVIIDLLVLMAAAQQPTGNWIGNALRLMLVDERFSMTFQGGRGSVRHALTQVLWEDTPTQNFIGRWAVRACELGGQRIGRGDLLVLGLAAANADPQVRPAHHAGYADVGGNHAHMSFGHGEHGCPFPAPELAEVIARTAIEVLLDRLPDIELAVAPDALHWRASFWMRGLHSLPITFSPAAQLSGGTGEFTPPG